MQGELGDIVYVEVDTEWVWHKDSCNGSNVNVGDTIVVSPSTSTNYFVRAESICGNTICANDSVSVSPTFYELDSIRIDSVFNSTDSIWYIPDTVCPQTSVELFAHYNGTLPPGYNVTWYEGACGSLIIGTGDSITISPDTTTTYLARMIGTCGYSSCQSITIPTAPGSIAATYITATNNNFCT